MPSFNSKKILDKIVQFGDNLAGTSARRLKGDVEALKRSQHLGPEGIPQSTINHVLGLSDEARSASINTRINTGLTVGGVGTAGFLGIHKYHQHKDDKIMARINKMYYN